MVKGLSVQKVGGLNSCIAYDIDIASRYLKREREEGSGREREERIAKERRDNPYPARSEPFHPTLAEVEFNSNTLSSQISDLSFPHLNLNNHFLRGGAIPPPPSFVSPSHLQKAEIGQYSMEMEMEDVYSAPPPPSPRR